MEGKWHKAFSIAVITLLMPIFTEAKVYLVSVGITDYPGTDMDLHSPANDAMVITWLYSQNSSMQYCLLLNEKATEKRIKSAMSKVFANAGPEDIVVFFFSGHGFEGGFSVYDGYITYQDIRDAMSKSECDNKMIFADACHSGLFRASDHSSKSEDVAARNSNVLLFLSSRNGEVSMERSDMANGYFTTYLQKGLRGGADSDGNRVITAKELFVYVHSNVVRLSEGMQHPVMWGKFADDMPIMIW